MTKIDDDDPFRTRFKLFMSVDIVGSTQHKQVFDLNSSPAAPQWARAVKNFYATVVSEAGAAWKGGIPIGADEGSDDLLFGGGDLHFWKTIGDEVIMWKELKHECQVWTSIACWLKMMERVRENFGADEKLKSLDVKGTAWIAEFPVRNKAIPMARTDALPESSPETTLRESLKKFYVRPDESSDVSSTVDFIGPGIDVGFRLAQFSSAKKFAISLDVAYLLSCAHKRESEFDRVTVDHLPRKMALPLGESIFDRLGVFYSGREPLKGVMGGVRYPKFWISSAQRDTLEHATDGLFRTQRPTVKWSSLWTYCDHLYRDRAKYMFRPFFDRSDSEVRPPKAFRQRYEKWREKAGIY